MTDGIRNVVVLSVDALRADHLSGTGYDRETTPALDALAESGITCPTCVSASTHTREAMPAMLSGRYAADATDASYELRAETVASVLGDDVTTGFFHSNPFVSRAYGFDEGFDAFDDDLRMSSNKFVALAQRALDKLRNRHYARAEEINDRSLSWLDDRDDDGPFLLWNHYMDVHGPYEPPAAYADRYADDPPSRRDAASLFRRAIKSPDSITDAERRTLVDLYDGEIRYTDDQIAAFLDGLERRGLREETLVIVTSDHGEAFDERGYFEHPRYLDEELLRVPLILAGPGVDSRTVAAPTSVLDVVPTALEALGFDHVGLPGVSLLSSDGSDAVVSSVRGEDDRSNVRAFAARSDAWKLVREYDVEREALVDERLYSVSDGVVDDENAVETSGSTARRERELLDAHVSERLDGLEGTTERETDDQLRDRLEALGYVDD